MNCQNTEKTRHGSLLLLIFLCFSLIFLLSSCAGDECTHQWGEREVIVDAVCGKGKTGEAKYTCQDCGATRSEELLPKDAHSLYSVAMNSNDCFVDSKIIIKCNHCSYSVTNTVAAYGEHKLDLNTKKIEGDKVMISCSRCDAVETRNATVRYEDFGAIGDGVADDGAAIRAAHEEANLYGLKVEGTAGKSYRIGAVESPIIIKTDTDWKGARIILDDSEIPDDSNLRGIWVFQIASDSTQNGRVINPGADFSLKKGQTNINFPLGKACMIKLENANKKIYLRYGPNASSGTTQTEMILVDAEGNVDPSTPIQYDYDTVTRMVVYSIDDAPISVGNARIETHVYNPKEHKPDYENYYCYYKRGINIARSNATLYRIDHTIVGEDMTVSIDRNGDGIIDIYGADKSYGVPYIGSFYFESCYNSKMVDSTVQGHQAYSFFQGANRNEPGNTRNEMGSYGLNAYYSIGVSLINVKQRENADTGEVITNRTMYHGIMASNFCRNISLDSCYFDRFDSHQGLHNATITNSTLGFGILVIGGGRLYIENTRRISGSYFISLRDDYNSIFDGDIIVRNCTAGKDVKEFIKGTWREFYNGLDNVITRSIDIDGLKVEANSFTLFRIANATGDSLTNATNPLFIPTSVTVRNTYLVSANGESALKPRASYFSDAFAEIEIDYKN